MKRVSLKVVGGVHEGRLIPLPVGNFLVGREQDCQLRPQSDLVSRHHCVFKIDEYGARLRDLGSTNGTFVNGIRLTTPVSLNDTDKVVIGDLEFRVVSEAATPAAVPEAVEAAAAIGNPDSVEGNAETILEVAGGTGDTNPGGDTITEMPAFDPANIDTETFTNAGTDSTVMPTQQPIQPPAAMPPMPQPYPPQQPQYNPYGQPAYGQMPYQQPMYPQQPMPYPPQPMAYPQQPYPQQPMPMQPAAPQPPAPAAVEAPADDIDVTLPPPSETGATEVAAKGSAGAGVNKEDPSSLAGDIIKQMQGRRPPGKS